MTQSFCQRDIRVSALLTLWQAAHPNTGNDLPADRFISPDEFGCLSCACKREHWQKIQGAAFSQSRSTGLAHIPSTVCEGVVARRAALRTELPVGHVMILVGESNMDSHSSIDPWLFYTCSLAMVCYRTHESAVSEIRLCCRSPSLSRPLMLTGFQSGSIRVL